MTSNSSRKGTSKEEDDDNDKDNTVYHDKKLAKRTSPFLQKTFLSILGPGIITGASDDDPSGIATYSQAGAQFGFGLLWLAVFQYPLMMVVQEMCAKIGLVTGSGLAAVIKKKYSRKIIFPFATLLLVANTINRTALLLILLPRAEIEYQLIHTKETLVQKTRTTKKHLVSIEFQI